MKFVSTKLAFLKVLKSVSVSLPSAKFAMPVLACVKIAVVNGHASLVLTNLETQTIDSFAPEHVTEDGEVLVPMQTLFDAVKTMPSDSSEISFEVDNGSETKTTTLKCGKRSFKIKSLATSDFPNVFRDEFEKQLHLPSSIVKSLFKKTSFAMSTSPDRYNLNGIYLSTEQSGDSNYLVVVATDGHRLSMAKKEVDRDFNLPGKIFPRKAISEVLKLLDSGESPECVLSVSSSIASFGMGNVKFYTKLLDASFPDYKKVIPYSNTKMLEVNKNLLQDEISAISTIAKERGLTVNILGNRLTLSMTGTDGDTSSSEVSCTFSEKEEFKTVYNPKFLLECLSSLDSENVRFGFGQENSPVLIQSTDDASISHVVMPMKGDR